MQFDSKLNLTGLACLYAWRLLCRILDFSSNNSLSSVCLVSNKLTRNSSFSKQGLFKAVCDCVFLFFKHNLSYIFIQEIRQKNLLHLTSHNFLTYSQFSMIDCVYSKLVLESKHILSLFHILFLNFSINANLLRHP